MQIGPCAFICMHGRMHDFVCAVRSGHAEAYHLICQHDKLPLVSSSSLFKLGTDDPWVLAHIYGAEEGEVKKGGGGQKVRWNMVMCTTLGFKNYKKNRNAVIKCSVVHTLHYACPGGGGGLLTPNFGRYVPRQSENGQGLRNGLPVERENVGSGTSLSRFELENGGGGAPERA